MANTIKDEINDFLYDFKIDDRDGNELEFSDQERKDLLEGVCNIIEENMKNILDRQLT